MPSGHSSSRSFGDDVSRLQSRLVLEADRRGARVVSLFGAAVGAGATTMSVSVARGLAAQSLPVALVDASATSPSIHKLFRIDPTPGVAECLSSGDASRAARSVDVADLHVVPAGSWPAQREAYLPERWKKLFSALRDAHRVVIVDAGSADSPHADGIAKASDGVVLVLECGRSRWEQVASFGEHMDEIGVPLLGVILNKRRLLVPGILARRG